MKNIIIKRLKDSKIERLFLIIFLIFQFFNFEIAYAQASYDSVAAFTAKTTIGITDIFPFQTKVANKYTWRKITGASMWDRITDTTEARITALLAASNSWDGINNFDGATFNSGSHGTVTFTDSVWHATGVHYVNRVYPTTSSTSQIGTLALPYENIWARKVNITNSGGTDSATISIDADGNLSIPKLTVTETMTIDSSATFDVIAFTPHGYTLPNVSDTILTLVSANRYSMIELDLPGDMTTGVSRIYVEGAQKGMILRIYNGDAAGYEMKFEDYIGNDDNLYMSGDFSGADKYDYIEFQCVVESIIGQTWMQTGESNN